MQQNCTRNCEEALRQEHCHPRTLRASQGIGLPESILQILAGNLEGGEPCGEPKLGVGERSWVGQEKKASKP